MFERVRGVAYHRNQLARMRAWASSYGIELARVESPEGEGLIELDRDAVRRVISARVVDAACAIQLEWQGRQERKAALAATEENTTMSENETTSSDSATEESEAKPTRASCSRCDWTGAASRLGHHERKHRRADERARHGADDQGEAASSDGEDAGPEEAIRQARRWLESLPLAARKPALDLLAATIATE